VSSDNNFADKAINRFVSNKDASLSISLPSIKADDSKPKEESSNKKIEAEKESKAQSVYEDYLENWKQGDPIPIIPPGKDFILCRVNLDDTRAEKEAGYYDTPELTKKPYKKSSSEEQLIEFKNLGPKLSESLMSLIGRVAKSRGLWVDDKNKLRCPPGSPAANQFTDITGSNCFIPSPETAAGSARRAVRRAVNGADILSSPLGGRTDTSFAGTEQRVQGYTTDDFDMVHAAMGVGGRIGMPDRMKGPVWNRGRAVRGTQPGKKSWQLSAREQRERGKILTTQADVLHRRFMGQGAPLGLTRDARATLRAMDRQIASPSDYLLPSGNPVGDILNKGNFMRAMTELFPNIDPNEIEQAFDNSIPAGLTLKERVEAQIVVRTFFEGMIFEAIQNPDHFKWVTQFNTGMIGNDPLCAFEVLVSPFAPSPLTGGRRASVAVTNLARSGTQVGETGGMHVTMTFNPMAAYLYARQARRTRFSDGSGEFDSLQGKALYLGVHEAGHVVDFGEKFKALGLDPNNLSRFGRTTTLVSTPSGPARQPNFYSGGWDVNWSMVTNPTGNPSVQEMMDAAAALQTNSYTGSRFGGRRIDLQDDLNKFHLGFTDAFVNNINTTPEEHELMAQFAGGDYAATLPQEARAEFYATRRLFGESTKFPSTVYPSGGPIKTGLKEMNLVEKFAESEGLRRATSEANSGLIPASDIPTRARTLQGEVLNELKVASRDTFGVTTGGWNVSGLMSTPERNGRVSLHARRVQDFVAATEIQTQRKRRGTNIPSGVSGKMSTPEIRKPSRPREPDNGPYTGRFVEIFSGVKDFDDFRERYRKQDIVYFDYETTGFGADGNMPVQIGAVRMRGGQVVERFNIFVNPGIPLGTWAQKNLRDIDGNPLTDTWLAQQASLRDAHEQLIDFFGEDALLGGQYTPFDLEVFDRVTKDLGISYKPGGVFDSKALADETLPRWTPDKPDGPMGIDAKTGEKKGSSSLGPLAEYLGVELGEGWHTADADAEASALVTERMLDRAVDNPDTTPKTILDSEEMSNIVERRRKKFTGEMEQYERDKIDYEAAVSGKMSVPRFETANGSVYERQSDGKYKRRKDPSRSTTMDSSVVETTYDNTVFLSPDAKYAVQLAADRGRHLNSNGDLMGLSYDDRNLDTAKLLKLRRDGATFDEAFEKAGGVVSYYQINKSEIRELPQVGLHPFEWDNDGRRTHTGSPVASVTRRPGNDLDETPSAGSGVSGKMTLSQAETRKSTVDEKLERYKKAVKDYDETGEWKGAEYGVVTALPKESDAALYLDNVDVTPRNLNFRDVAAAEADEQKLTGDDKEKYIAEQIKKRRADMDRKIQFLEREQKLSEKLLQDKRTRSEQNVLDIEDISPEEIEKLKVEAAEIRRLKSATTTEDRERFQSLISDGDTRYMTHAGESELRGGVLQGSSSIGAEASYSGGTGGGAGDTRGLNNEMVAGMKGNVASFEKSVAVLDKAIKEAEESGTYTFMDVHAEFAFREVDRFGDRIRKSDFGTVFDIVNDIGDTKEKWIEKLKFRRNEFAKELEAEKNILTRIEKDDYQFLSAEDADRLVNTGGGYFGRYSHRQIPEEIGKNLDGESDISSMASLGNKPEKKDPEMAQRWIDSLRGTVWMAKGTKDVEWTGRLGPTSERQILGKTKPIVGFSSRKKDKDLLFEILPALMARAINDDKNNGGTIRPLAVAGRIDATQGVSGKMTSAEKAVVSQDFTKEVLGKAKGFGFDIDAKASKERIDEQIAYLVRDASMRSQDATREITLPQGAIDVIQKGVESGEIFTSSNGPGNQLTNLYLAIAPQMPKDWPKGEKIPPHVALEITKQIHLARGDSAAAQKVDDFRQYLKTATPEQLEADMREAASSFGKSIDKRVIVQTRSMKPFAAGQHSILTHHDIEERKKAGVQSMSFMGDNITSEARTKTEANLLGIPMDDTPETRDVRPSSGYVLTRKASQARVDNFRKLYGDDVQVMHDAPVGRPLEQLSQGTSKYGESAFILRPEVAERTRIYNGDTVDLMSNDPAPVRLSSVEEEGAFFGSSLGMLYDFKTQEQIPTPAGGFESSIERGQQPQQYKEALVLGRFKPEEIEVIHAPLSDFRRGIGDMETSGLNPDFEGNLSLLIDMAQTRDELNTRYGIEVVPIVQSGFTAYGTEDVELFNPSMTKKWFKLKFPNRTDESEIIPDDSVTPYEATIRMAVKDSRNGNFPLLEYRGPSGVTLDERNASRLKALEAELDRTVKVRQSQASGVSGRMAGLTPEQMTQRNESIMKGIEDSGGSWGEVVPDSYRDSIKEIEAASFAAGGQFNVTRPPTKQDMRDSNAAVAKSQYEQIQKHIRGEVADPRFKGLELEFLQHLGQMTPEQFEQELKDASISFHAGLDPRPRVQVPIPEFTTILEHGYKTTHEIRSDHSAKPIRLPYEATLGIHPKTPANLRPASGYVVHKDWTEAELRKASEIIEDENLTEASPELLQGGERLRQIREGRGLVEIYGGLEVILRPEVGERTRYLEGDSLNTKGIPTPLVGNDIESIQYALNGGNDYKDVLVERLYGHWKKDHGATRRHAVEMPPPGFGSAPVRAKNSNYMEALIAGSFDAGDIEEIVVSGTDYVPYEWILESRPQPGRKQQVYGGQPQSGRITAPQFNHLFDEKQLSEKLGLTSAEAKIAIDIVKESLNAVEGQPGLFNKEHRALAAIAMSNRLKSRGIKLTVKTPGGVDILDPKALYPESGDGATAEEAVVMRVEARLREMVRAKIAEAGRKAQENAASLEKVVV
jgi:DNA polymerase III epsilon subunit-like protein